MKRSRFDLSHLHSTTLDAGYLIPILLQETIPNDKFRIGMDSFIRATPMVAPLMHQVNFFTQYWYVPYRLLWDEWEEFITGGEDGTAAPAFPVITAGSDGFATGSLADYFGFPTLQGGIEVSAMPFRAMAEIWNTRYRDEDLQSELPISYNSGADTTTNTMLLSPSWKKDYFTTARASTQRGIEVGVPVEVSEETSYQVYAGLSCKMRVTANNSGYNRTYSPSSAVISRSDFNAIKEGTVTSLTFTGSVTAPVNSNITSISLRTTGDSYINLNLSRYIDANSTLTITIIVDNFNILPSSYSPYVSSIVGYGFSGLSVGFSYNINVFSVEGSVTMNSVGSIPVTSLRLASSLQRFAERSMKYGNRYEEFIQREFGISPRDSRIQRPEYLGGSKSVLQISEVLQTAEGENTGVGTMRGHGVSTMKQRGIRFTAPEHGLIIGLLSIRPLPVYTQGIHREWLKRSRLDFYIPELANIGQQEILQQEIYATSDNKDVVFGYGDRYQEYRYRAPKVTGEFRTSVYDSWNMARFFSSPPVISDGFINMANSTATFKRPFADRTAHSFLAMLRNNVVAYRPIPKRAKNILK